MSNFIKKTKHPITGKLEKAEWIDSLFGLHHYGVVFPSDRNKYPKNISLTALQMIAFDEAELFKIIAKTKVGIINRKKIK